MQNAYVSLDEDGIVRVGVNGEIGNAIPAHVFHQRTLRFSVSPFVDGKALQAYLLGDGRELLAVIHQGHSVDWDGNNMVGRLDQTAQDAVETLESGLKDLEEDNICEDTAGYLFSCDSVGKVWGDRPLAEAVAALTDDIESEGVVLGGDSVEDTLIEAACHTFESHGHQLPRAIVRELAARGKIDVRDYAEWIADHGRGDDVAESAKDASDVTVHLDIHDSRANDDQIRAGTSAARECLAERHVTPAQAYIASIIRAHDAPLITAHLSAWEDAEMAAFTACFEGWAEWPEAAVMTCGSVGSSVAAVKPKARGLFGLSR